MATEYTPEVQQVLDKMFVGYHSQLVGTLKHVTIYDNLLALIFEDGTWALFRSYSGYDNDVGTDLEANPKSVMAYELFHLELITAEQYKKQSDLEFELQKQREASHEEEIYQRVKARKEQNAKSSV